MSYPYRVTFGWSNYKDFRSRKQAKKFIREWKRPSSWGNDPLKENPKLHFRYR